jgi:DNA-binding response OmpR family regulator
MARLAPAVLVFEKRPRLEAGLKRGLEPERVLVRPCRSSADLLELCRAMPGSVAVIDFAVGGAAVLQWLTEIATCRVDVAPIIIATPKERELEWPLRELGTSAVVFEMSSCRELTALCRRFLPA